MAAASPSQMTEASHWYQDTTLGTGGFGTVHLWKNHSTSDAVAMKTLKTGRHMKAEGKERWRKEIRIMFKLSHPNVVRVFPVPSGIDISAYEVEPLAMEYCEKGDLRKLLRRPENCCGLSECSICDVLRDIGAAIEYLHAKRIIHRDLKPENILLTQVNEKTVHKLTDYGYAKDLSQESLCHTFVGTMQYLAPELFSSDTYSGTVDYWSLGVVIFECVTGIRPFNVSNQDSHWLKVVSQKSNADICMDSLTQELHKAIPEPNNLSKLSRQCFVPWFRLMLTFDACLRGGGKDDAKRPRCFSLMDTILNMKKANVYCVATNQLLSEALEDGTPIVDKLSIQTGTSVPNQEYITENGDPVDPSNPQQEWGDLVYLLRKESKQKPPAGDSLLPLLPPLAAEIKDSQYKHMNCHVQKRAWSHAVFYCRHTINLFNTLIQAGKACLKRLLRKEKSYTDALENFSHEAVRAEAEATSLLTSIKTDLEQSRFLPATAGLTEYISHATNMQYDLDGLVNKVKELQALVNESRQAKWDTKIEDHRHVFKCDVPKHQQVHNQINSQVTVLYDKLRLAIKDNKQLPNNPIVDCLKKYIDEHKKRSRLVRECISKMNQLYEHLCQQHGELHGRMQEVRHCRHQVRQTQDAYQKQLWHCLRHTAHAQPASFPGDAASFPGDAAFTNGGVLPEAIPDDLASMLTSWQLDDIENIVAENTQVRHKMTKQISSLP